MNFSAALSSSPVVTPVRALPRSMLRQRASTRPAAAICSISSGVFRTITKDSVVAGGRLELVLEPQRRQRGPYVVVDLAGRALAVEAAQDALLLVAVHERARLVVVDLEPVLDGLRLVVVALHELRAVLVADALVLRRVELDVVEVPVLDAHPATAEAADHLVVVDIDHQRGCEPAVAALERVLEHLGLLHRAREAVEQEPVGRLGLVDPLHDDLADQLVRDEVALVHVALGLLAELGL